MNTRSRLPIARAQLSARLGAGLFAVGIGLLGCGPPDGAQLFPEAAGGCEAPTEALTQTNEDMLPGRVCAACHTAGGQASNSPFTVSGTVFGALNAPCNPGGVNGKFVFVEILNPDMTVQDNGYLPVNNIGNFRSSAHYIAPLRVRVVSYNGDPTLPMAKPLALKSQTMMTTLGRTDTGSIEVSCNDCHQLPGKMVAPAAAPPGRIYFTP